MGGSRCNFRNCKVSTSRNPGMHFFRFPKNSKHLKDWIRFSNLKNFFEIPESQQRNKVICGRHFKATCFMNYKQDRLIATAVPSITRLSTEWALDFEHDLINPKLIKFEVSNAPHLIPPPDFKDPQCFNGEDQLDCVAILKDYGINDSCDTNQEPGNKRIKLMDAQKTDELSKGENRFTEEFLENLINDDADWNENVRTVTYLQTELPASNAERHETCLKETRIKELEALLFARDEELKETKAQLKTRDHELCLAQQRVKLLTEQTEQLTEQLTKETEAKEKFKTLLSKYDTKYKELWDAHNELKAQQNHLESKQTTAVLMKTETPESDRRISLGQQLSKQQLFNGIKRYLSQTMVALLRLQLAPCGTERNWRPDEKRLAMDLLSLGPDVYKYFTDEWLIRLPSINLVSDWQNQYAAHDDEDEL